MSIEAGGVEADAPGRAREKERIREHLNEATIAWLGCTPECGIVACHPAGFVINPEPEIDGQSSYLELTASVQAQT